MDNGYLPSDDVHADDLTWREHEVLLMLAERQTNREIADQLYLAESTVKDYVGRILSKLHVKNRRQAVERAKDLGLLDWSQERMAKPLVNLPADPTAFVGRKDELMEIQRCLGETRLLTLIGPGGIGKTRLAIKAAKEAVDDFEHGTFFVSLAPISSADHLIQTIAEGVRFPITSFEDPQQQLLHYLKRKRLLLVMDNFEHLLDGVGIVSEILQVSSGVKILATSREKLNLRSEMTLSVGGMTFPERADSRDTLNYDAIALFVQSARKVCPGFDPSGDELEQIVNMCYLVGGMPLAIELAAAWMQILNPGEIYKELEKGLDILATEAHDAPERQRSIRAVFDHSWSMLHKNEREILKSLSVFRGGFTRQAAQEVTGASLQQIAGLVNKSLLSHDPNSGRLGAHELLRQYAQERLEKNPDDNISARESHAAYYAGFMAKGWEQLKGPKQMLALAKIEADIENVRAAWRYSLHQRNVQHLWMFIHGLWHVYWIRWWNHAGMELFAEAAKILAGEQDEGLEALRASSLAFQGYFMAWLDLAERGYELAKDGVAILRQHDHPEALVFAYDSQAVNAYFLDRFTEETQAINKMVKIATAIGDKWLMAFTLFAASMAALIKDHYNEAWRLAETNLNLYEEIGDKIGSSMPLIVLGHVALARGEYEQARAYYLRCLNISEKTGFYYSVQTSSKYLGKVALEMGETAEAEKFLHQSMAITKEIGFLRDIINLLYEFARLRVAQDNLVKACELLALVVQHPASNQSRLGEGPIRDSAQELLAQLEVDLPREIYMAALERGRGLELDEVIIELVDIKS